VKSLPSEVLAELQTEYIKGFPQKIAAIDEALQKKQWLALREVLHKLAGSGSTYQMPEISETARAAEVYLEKTKSPDIEKIRSDVACLKGILEEHIRKVA
jgi:HPt (histidine-containing phosphotransfer) domain-containing protein